jgi:hypothetical protein
MSRLAQTILDDLRAKVIFVDVQDRKVAAGLGPRVSMCLPKVQ